MTVFSSEIIRTCPRCDCAMSVRHFTAGRIDLDQWKDCAFNAFWRQERRASSAPGSMNAPPAPFGSLYFSINQFAKTGHDRATDEEQFFRDLGATAEEAMEQVRGVEKNYFSMLQNTAFAVPWIVDLSKKLQSYADRNIAAALDFSHQLSGATGFLDLARIQFEYAQKQFEIVRRAGKGFRRIIRQAIRPPSTAALRTHKSQMTR